MNTTTTKKHLTNDLEDEEENFGGTKHRRKQVQEQPRRHKSINYKRLWEEHVEDYDELDEFYGK